MRCATLAQALVGAGHAVEFLCRALPGNLNDWLAAQKFTVHRFDPIADTTHADAAACRAVAESRRFDWLVVDHNELDVEWERSTAGAAAAIAAIDDTGRAHQCDLLLDQNYPNPRHRRYEVPAGCERLLGPDYALLRPDFAAFRAVSLRRSRRSVDRLLLFMSGGDAMNETSKALAGIAGLRRPLAAVDVVIGASNPHRATVEAACARLPQATLHVQTSAMAALMSAADCMIGGGGNTSWERCVLGLPAIVTLLADNQVSPAVAVEAVGAHRVLGWHDALAPDDYTRALEDLDRDAIAAMSAAAAQICDGKGTERVAARLAVRAARRD
jgi:UDP-2,4-diacetamido-2,4,6-trideoxy-beta-L-altropyranose hydrolase